MKPLKPWMYSTDLKKWFSLEVLNTNTMLSIFLSDFYWIPCFWVFCRAKVFFKSFGISSRESNSSGTNGDSRHFEKFPSTLFLSSKRRLELSSVYYYYIKAASQPSVRFNTIVFVCVQFLLIKFFSVLLLLSSAVSHFPILFLQQSSNVMVLPFLLGLSL